MLGSWIALDPRQQEELARIARREHRPVKAIVQELLDEALSERRRRQQVSTNRLVQLDAIEEHHRQAVSRGDGSTVEARQVARRVEELREERADELRTALDPHDRR